MIERLVRPPTVATAVANTIRDAILSGDLEQGTRLREAELSRSLDVAQSTVREALRALQDDGLVEVFPHRGAFVTQLSPRKVREIYTLRQVLEPHAVGLAMEKDAYGPQELKAIDALLRRIGELERKGDAIGCIKAVARFHYLICEPSDHRLLLDVLKGLQSQAMMCMINLKLYDCEQAPDELQHGEIFEAIRSGDRALAQERLKKHLDASKKAMLGLMTVAQAA